MNDEEEFEELWILQSLQSNFGLDNNGYKVTWIGEYEELNALQSKTENHSHENFLIEP